MRKYKVLILNCTVLFASNVAVSFISSKASIVFMWVCLIFLVISTIAMIFMKTFLNSSAYDIATWKNIRNLILYALSVVLGNTIINIF